MLDKLAFLRHVYERFSGKLLVDKKVGHVFQLEDGLIKRFDIRTTP